MQRNTVTIQIKNRTVQALVDSGASRSVASAEFIAKLQIPHKHLEPGEPSSMFVADGRSVSVLGKAEMTIKVNGLCMPCEALILPNIGYSVILGLDFLEANRAQVDFANRVITFFNDLTTAHLSTSYQRHAPHAVRTLHPTVLPPLTETIVPITLQSNNLSSGDAILEPLPVTRGQKFLCARSTIDLSQTTAVCKILNPTNQVIWLPRNKVLATVEPICPQTLAVLTDIGQPTPDTVSKTDTQADQVGPTLGDVSSAASVPTTLDELGVCYQSTNLSPEENVRLKALLETNVDIFSKSLSDLTATTYIEHTIHTDSCTTPIRQRAYRASPSAKKEIDSQIEKMLKANIIEPSCSMWSSPVVLVRKRNGEIRMCVDYRKLNAVTKPISFPLPQLHDVFDAMTEARPQYFSLLDLRSGYHQIPLDRSTMEKSSFVTHSGQYQYLRLPFGLSTGPSSFQCLMARIFHGINFKSVLCYIDDLLIYSQTFDDHIQHIQEVFKRLKDANLKLHPGKCQFGVSKIMYLGHVLSPKGMEVDKSKIDVIETYPRPTTQKEIRAFLGLAGYYRKFIQNFSKMADPLNRLLRQGMDFIWDDACETAFTNLKEALSSTPVLVFPDTSKPYVINCDACTVGIGYVLAQEDESGREHPICYGGRSLSKFERNYTITELECLALVEAVKEFYSYLGNSFFTVYTDHVSLKYLQTLKAKTTGRLLRWSIALQGHNFEIKYKSGKTNVNADALSRRLYPPTSESQDADEECIVANLDFKESSSDINVILEDDLEAPPDDESTRQNIAQQQRQCPDAAPMIRYLEQGDLPDNDKEARRIVIESSEYAIDNDLLYHYFQPRSKGSSRSFINQLVVPKSVRQSILNGFHEDSSHPGFHRCYLSIRRKYFWKNMYADVKRHIVSCQNCQQCKYPVNLNRAPLQPLEPKQIFGRWSVDILKLPRSKEGYNYILLCVESLTRWPEAIPLKDQSAQTIAQALFREIFTRYGPPKTLLSDRGPNFMSSIVAELSQLLGVKRIHTASYNPKCNGACERYNRSIWQALRLHCKHQEDWADFIPAILFSFRAMTSANLDYSPFFLMFGKEMTFPVDLQMALQDENHTTSEYVKRLVRTLESARQAALESTLELQARNKKQYDIGTQAPTYALGDLVWMFNPVVPRGQKPKLYRKFTGPFYVTSKIGEKTYKLRHAHNNKEIKHPVNADRLKPFVDRRDYLEPQADSSVASPTNNEAYTPDVSTDNSSQWCEADRLTGMKFVNKKRVYRVVWKNPSHPPSWIPEADVSDCLKREFHIHRTRTGKLRKRDTPQRFKHQPAAHD